MGLNITGAQTVMQTQTTTEIIPPEIAANAREIAKEQERERRVSAQLAEAINRRNDIHANLNVERQRNIRGVPGLERAEAEAAKRVEDLRVQHREVVDRVYQLHVENGDLHRRRRLAVALGDRKVSPPVAFPDIQADPTLVALTAQHAELTASLDAARGKRVRALAEVEQADRMARTARIGRRVGKTTREDLEKLEADVIEHRNTVADLEQEIEEITEAVQSIARDREAREDALRADIVPRLRAEYEIELAAMFDRLRDAVLPAARAWALFDLLERAGATPTIQPWRELRLADDSKFMVTILEAVKAGIVK